MQRCVPRQKDVVLHLAKGALHIISEKPGVWKNSSWASAACCFLINNIKESGGAQYGYSPISFSLPVSFSLWKLFWSFSGSAIFSCPLPAKYGFFWQKSYFNWYTYIWKITVKKPWPLFVLIYFMRSCHGRKDISFVNLAVMVFNVKTIIKALKVSSWFSADIRAEDHGKW